MNYDRMNPEWNELKKRLQEYSSIDYGAPAYPLSTAEAKMIVTMVISLQIMIKYHDVFKKLDD